MKEWIPRPVAHSRSPLRDALLAAGVILAPAQAVAEPMLPPTEMTQSEPRLDIKAWDEIIQSGRGLYAAYLERMDTMKPREQRALVDYLLRRTEQSDDLRFGIRGIASHGDWFESGKSDATLDALISQNPSGGGYLLLKLLERHPDDQSIVSRFQTLASASQIADAWETIGTRPWAEQLIKDRFDVTAFLVHPDFFKRFPWCEPILRQKSDAFDVLSRPEQFRGFSWVREVIDTKASAHIISIYWDEAKSALPFLEEVLRSKVTLDDLLRQDSFYARFPWRDDRLAEVADMTTLKYASPEIRKKPLYEKVLRSIATPEDLDKEPRLFEEYGWVNEVRDRDLVTTPKLIEMVCASPEPWARRMFPKRMIQQMLSDPSVVVPPELPSAVLSDLRNFIIDRPVAAVRTYPQYADAIPDALGVMRANVDFVSFRTLYSSTLDRGASARQAQGSKSALLTVLTKAISPSTLTRAVPSMSPDVASALLEESGYSADRALIEAGMGLYDDVTLHRINEFETYRQDILKMRVPKSVPWRIFYPLAGGADESYWRDMETRYGFLYDRALKEANPVPLLKELSRQHGHRDTVALTQAAYIAYSELHARGLLPTEENLKRIVEVIRASRASYDSIEPYARGREVLMVANGERWNRPSGGDRFMTKALVEKVAELHGGAPRALRATGDAASDARLKKDVLATIAASKKPMTFLFDGHGLYISEKDNQLILTNGDRASALSAADIAEAFATKYAGASQRLQAEKEPDIAFLDVCYGYDIGQRINEILSSKGLPTLVIATSAERHRLSLGSLANKWGSTFSQAIAGRTIGAIRGVMNELGPLTKPAFMAPLRFGIDWPANASPTRRFIQTSGYVATDPVAQA